MARKRERRSLIRLNDLSLRVSIPYRVGLEFQRRWRDVDRGNRDAYDSLEKDIQDQGHQLEALFNQYTRHQTIDAKQEIIKAFIGELCKRLKENKAKHPSAGQAEQIFFAISRTY